MKYIIPLLLCATLMLTAVRPADAQENGDEIEPVFFEDFNDEELPDGWELFNLGDLGREWVFLEPVVPVREDGVIGTGYTLFEPFEGGIALAEGVGTFPGIDVNVGMQTPAIDLSQLDEVILQFDQNMRASGTSFGLVEVSLDGESWTEVATITEAGESVRNSGLFEPFEYDIFPETFEVNITELAAGESEVYIRFVFNDDDGPAFWWMIDNVSLFEPLPRPNPAVAVSPEDGETDLRLTAGLEWAQGSGITPDGYFLSFGTDTPPSDIEDMLDVGDTTVYHPEGELEYNTTYYWQVFPYDAEGVIDGEIEIWSFTTKADPVVTEFPYSEQFDSADPPALPLAWRFEDANNSGSSWDTSDFFPAVGENSARVAWNNEVAKDDWLFSPAFELEPGNLYEVSFQYSRGEFIAPRTEKMKVHLATGTSSEDAFEEPFFNDDAIVSETYIDGAATFSVEQADRYHLAWHAYSDAAQRNLYLDDIGVRIVPPEPDLVFEPESLAFDELFVGGEQVLSISLDNAGAETLELSFSLDDTQNFMLSDESLDLGYASPETLEISFNPQETGDLSTTLSISSNDPEQPEVSIPVSASAVPAPEAVTDLEDITLSIEQGQSETVDFSLSNEGGNPLEFALSSRPAGSDPASNRDAAWVQRLSHIAPLSDSAGADVTGTAFSANENQEPGLLTTTATIQDSITYDKPPLTPDIVVGIPSPEIPFWGATRFTAGENGFYLTHLRNWFQTDQSSAPVLIQVYRGGDNPEDGELVSQQNTNASSANGRSFLIELLDPVLFEPGEDFWVVFRFSTDIESPQGVDEDVTGQSDRFRYWQANQESWIELPDPGWAYKTRALSAGLDWISFDPLAGEIAPGEEQPLSLTLNTQTLEPGSYTADVQVSTNDPLARAIRVELELMVTAIPEEVQVQLIHNAADPALETVDVYLNGELSLGDFSYLEATAYLTIPAGETEIALTQAGAPIEEAIYTETLMLERESDYQIVAGGVGDPDGFPDNPNGFNIGFELFTSDAALMESGSDEVAVNVFHGVTDAPAVALSSGGDVLIDQVFYGQYSDYLFLPNDTYTLDISAAATGDIVGSFEADLSMLSGQAVTVIASGFLAPPESTNRPFGLYAVLENGDVAQLPPPPTSTEPETDIPDEFALAQNYPNPFNPATTIEYALPEASEVRLEVYNLQGQRVATLVNGQQPAGTHSVSFDAQNLSSGMYLYRIQAGSYTSTQKMMLLK